MPQSIKIWDRLIIRSMLRALDETKWEESKHPRQPDGKFGTGGSSSASPKSKTSQAKVSTPAPAQLEKANFPPGSRSAEVQDKFAKQLTSDWEGAKQEYTKRFGSKLINIDEARELSPDYEKERSLAPAVQGPASDLVKAIYADRLADPSTGKSVCFTAGGPGSGKSSGIESVKKLKKLTDRAGIVYDGVFDKFGSATQKIDQALEAGKTAKVMFVYRDPAEAFRNGILKRAARMEQEKGTGRIVPAAYAAMVYSRVQEAQKDVRNHYADNPNVKFYAVDNSRGPGQAKSVNLEDLPGQNVTKEELAEKFNKIADEEYAAGRISKKIWEGVKQ